MEGDIKAIMEEHHGNANSASLQASFGTFFFYVGIWWIRRWSLGGAEIDQDHSPGLWQSVN